MALDFLGVVFFLVDELLSSICVCRAFQNVIVNIISEMDKSDADLGGSLKVSVSM